MDKPAPAASTSPSALARSVRFFRCSSASSATSPLCVCVCFVLYMFYFVCFFGVCVCVICVNGLIGRSVGRLRLVSSCVDLVGPFPPPSFESHSRLSCVPERMYLIRGMPEPAQSAVGSTTVHTSL